MTLGEVLAAVFQGEFDDDLTVLKQALLDRSDKVAKRKFREINVGSLVQFNQFTRPEYLQGAYATVTAKKVTRLTVTMGEDRGRFMKGQPINTSVQLVDLISLAEED